MLIALVGKAYTGKTSIAQELERRGFTLLSFTDHLKALAAYALNSVHTRRDDLIGVADILANKPRYRRFIQEFGSLIGYETDPGWIEAFLEDELPGIDLGKDHPDRANPHVVIDCLRSAAQIKGARKYGAKIVGVGATVHNRGIFAGNPALVTSADSHPIDGALNVWEMDTDHVVINDPDRTISHLVEDLLGTIEFVEAL